ncbi:MAG: YdcF family protein [Rhodospirillales bacterium]|nr:YdcF family protein [Rhodospirillales bacterium]
MVRTLTVALILLIGLGGGFILFVETLPRTPDKATQRADAIVVLTGGAARVAAGLRLLAAGRAETLLISGVHRDTDMPDILALAPDVPESLGERITLDRDAADTVGNARETAAWAEAHAVESLYVVTAAYHMPRSLLQLERALPGVELLPHPVFPERVEQRSWWSSSTSASLLLGEYLKYLFTLATSPFGARPGSS